MQKLTWKPGENKLLSKIPFSYTSPRFCCHLLHLHHPAAQAGDVICQEISMHSFPCSQGSHSGGWTHPWVFAGAQHCREPLWETLPAVFNTHKNQIVEVSDSIKAFTSNRENGVDVWQGRSLAWTSLAGFHLIRAELSSLSVGTDNRQHYLLESGRRCCCPCQKLWVCSPDSCQLLGHTSCALAAPTPQSVSNVPFPQGCRAQEAEHPDSALSLWQLFFWNQSGKTQPAIARKDLPQLLAPSALGYVVSQVAQGMTDSY